MEPGTSEVERHLLAREQHRNPERTRSSHPSWRPSLSKTNLQRKMRRPTDDLADVRAPPEAIARWALETTATVQEATWSALSFLTRVEHASATLLPVPALLQTEQAVQDPDGFLRMPRAGLEHFRLRSTRAMAWMEQLLFFRERFPAAARRDPPEGVGALAQTFSQHGSVRERAIDLLVRESVVPVIEDLFLRTLTYPPLNLVLQKIHEIEPQLSADARRLAAQIVGPLDSTSVWAVRRRLIASVTRAVLGARPMLEELERAGFTADRAGAARGFARRLEEAVGELSGTRVLPEALIERLAGKVVSGETKKPRK
jgi:hypothetical protein